MINKRRSKKAFNIYLLLVLISFFPIIFIFIIFNDSFSTKLEDWGSWGNYVAGSVGTLLSAVTIILIVRSINLQREEFENMILHQKETLKVVEYQNSESSFFKHIEVFDRIINSIHGEFKIHEETYNFYGREYFYYFARHCLKLYISFEEDNSDEKKKAKENYVRYLSSNKFKFSNYILFIHDIIRFCENQQQSTKERYLRTFKSTLSNSELIVIAYLGLHCDTELYQLVKENKILEYIDLEKRDNIMEGHRPLAIVEEVMKYWNNQ